MNCYACDSAAVNACKRCAKPYCDEHGNAANCADCLRPASALPSFNLYRGALLAMLVGTAVAVVLIVKPPGESSGSPSVVGSGLTPTPTPSRDDETASTVAPETPEADETAAALAGSPTTAPAPAGTPTPPLPTPQPAVIEYVVQEGDSLFSIAEVYLPAGGDLATFVASIASLNGIDQDAVLNTGQVIRIPNPNAP